MASTTEQFEYNPFSPALIEDPYPTYQVLRDRFPVYYNSRWDFWALSRFDDVQAAARDWETFTTTRGVDLDAASEEFGLGEFLTYDPPRHGHLRNILRPVFSPRGIKALEGKVQVAVDGLVDSFLERGEADLAREFAFPLPLIVICELLGVPREDREDLGDRIIRFQHRLPDDRRIPEDARHAFQEVRDYFDGLVAERRRSPRNDVVSTIVTAQVEGQLLDQEEAVGLCLFVFVAGTDTVAGGLSSALLLLAQHPDQREHLIREPSLIPEAFEECLRFESPLQHMARTATREIKLYSHRIPVGARVALLYGSANRDEQRFDHAEEFRITRERKRHLAFGEGLHFCLGAPLARLQGRLAIGTLLARAPRYELAGAPQQMVRSTQRGLRYLPVSW